MDFTWNLPRFHRISDGRELNFLYERFPICLEFLILGRGK
jgi:hypothetical protein